jgi:hypothetical protein
LKSFIVLQVHGNDGVGETPIIAVVQHNQRRPILPARAFDVGNLDDYNVAALHW